MNRKKENGTSSPFNINVSDETLDRIHMRVADYPWHAMSDLEDWSYGANLDYHEGVLCLLAG